MCAKKLDAQFSLIQTFISRFSGIRPQVLKKLLLLRYFKVSCYGYVFKVVQR